MSYLIAKRFHERGCIAVEEEQGPALDALIDFLSMRTQNTDIEILIVGNRETYGEFAPYRMIPTEKDFISAVLFMCDDNKNEVQ